MAEPARILKTKVFIGGEEDTVNEVTIGKSTDTVVIAGAQTSEGNQAITGTLIVTGATTLTGGIAADFALADGVDIATNTTTGSVIAAAVTQKLAFWGATPVVQPAGATQVAPAAYATGAFGLDSDAKMEALYDLVVAMRTALVNAGIIKGAA